MSYNARVFKVLIASPSDVASERTIIREVLSEWNIVHSYARRIVLLPIGWETHASPTMGESPQTVINKQILKDCDLLVGVFWTRIGTATEQYPSGTVEEIEEHIKTGRPTMLYFSDAPVHPDSVDALQYAALKKFKDSCKPRGLFETYTDINDFKNKFYRQLQLKVNQDAYFTEKSLASVELPEAISSVPDVPDLSREAQTLLKEAVQDANGGIMRLPHSGGLFIQTHEKGFVEENNPRSRAVWEGALQELEANGLIAAANYKREYFEVTRSGYEIAELLNP